MALSRMMAGSTRSAVPIARTMVCVVPGKCPPKQQQNSIHHILHRPQRPQRASSSTLRPIMSNASNGHQEYDYDLFTIGAGSGGVRASRVASGQYGARVAVCEMPFNPIASDTEGGAGGTCVLRGCVPKKLFVYGASFAEEFADARGFGWEVPEGIEFDWGSFLDKKNAELKRLNGVYMNILKNNGVEFIEGRGRIVDAHTVEVAGKKYTAKHILIATGGRAFVPPNVQGAELGIISDQALEINPLPKSIAIIGGGYIAVEFAGIFSRLGVETHLVYRQSRPLRGFDEEVRDFATQQYDLHGLHLHPNCSPTKITKRNDGLCDLEMDGHDGALTVETVMFATGRVPNTRGLGLEEVGVQLDKRGAVVVDTTSKTTVDSIWAVGDVTNRVNLTPVALMEGMAFCKTVFGNQPTAPDYEAIPTAVFSHPEIATVGLTEEAAVATYSNVDIYTSSFRPMKNTISGNESRTFMKIVVDGDSDKVLGFHMVGPDSAEIMQGMAIAVKFGITKSQLDTVVGIHPSAAEEFVTMRTPTRQGKSLAEGSVDAGVGKKAATL